MLSDVTLPVFKRAGASGDQILTRGICAFLTSALPALISATGRPALLFPAGQASHDFPPTRPTPAFSHAVG